MGLTLSTAFGPVWLRTGQESWKSASSSSARLHLPLHARRRQMSCGKARGVIKLATNCFSRRFKYTFSILGHNERDCSRPQLLHPGRQSRQRRAAETVGAGEGAGEARRHHWTLTNCPTRRRRRRGQSGPCRATR